jgi:hypothetical protein
VKISGEEVRDGVLEAVDQRELCGNAGNLLMSD